MRVAASLVSDCVRRQVARSPCGLLCGPRGRTCRSCKGGSEGRPIEGSWQRKVSFRRRVLFIHRITSLDLQKRRFFTRLSLSLFASGRQAILTHNRYVTSSRTHHSISALVLMLVQRGKRHVPRHSSAAAPVRLAAVNVMQTRRSLAHTSSPRAPPQQLTWSNG